MFGNADPNHTWNMAEVCSLNVAIEMEGTYTVKVWTANPRSSENNAYLLGQYDHVAGGTSNIFGCDIPSTVEVAYVGIISENGDRIIEPATVKDGKASVSFGVLGTRAVLPTNGSDLFSDAGKDKEFQKEDLYEPLITLPEDHDNTNSVSQDFEYVSTGEFVIYPIYTISSNAGSDGKGHRLGIYLCDADGNKTGNITWIWQSTINDKGETGTATWFDAYNSSTNQWETNLFAFSEDRNLKGWADTNGDGNPDPISRVDNPVVVWDGGTKDFISPYTKIRPEGIRINVPKGTRFGMVLDVAGGDPHYSNSNYNVDFDNNGDKDVYGATFKDEHGNLYLAFEDWKGGDKDFNDIVFIVPKEYVDKAPVIIDKETEDVSMSYIVACEDLGGTFDWDFNDVVYAIEHVSGQPTARIKLLAAGGTLPVYISYQNEVIKFGGEEDLHDAFGVDLNTPVNVGGYTANPLYSEEFTVDNNAFSMSTHASDFKIHVKYTDDSEGAEIGVPDRSKGQEPQAFLVADPDWQWPLEKVCITALYPEFAAWITNRHDATNWCGSVWGAGNSDVIIQNGTNSNLFDYDEASWYNGNVATIPLKAGQMNSKTAYQIVLTTSKDAVVQFKQSDGTKVELTNSDVIAGERNIFTLQGEALEALKDGCMTITFSDEVQITSDNCETLITELRWVESKAKPTLTANSMTFTVGDEGRQIEVTSNANDVFSYTYESSNESVATVSPNGTVTPVASGTAYITVKQSETDNYQAATVRVTVEVLAAPAQEPTEDEWFTNGNFAVRDAQGTTINWVTDPTDSDNGCIEVTTNANPVETWDAQFFVSIPGPENEIPSLKEGDKYRLTMKVRADVAQTVGSQSHSSPGNYIHYDAGVGNIDVTGEWKTIEKEITVTHDMSSSDNMRTIAFNLANSTQATNYYFDDVKLEIISRANLQDPNLNLNNSTLSMYVNDTQSVGFSKNGNGAISFAYSDNTVVSAALDGDSIKITGLKAGTATITVRLDAEGNYKTVKKTIEVTVQARQQVSPNLEINNSSVGWLTVGGYVENGFRSANSAPVVLTSSNPSIVTAVESTDNNGNRVVKLTGVSAGTATVTVRQEATAEFAAAEVTIDVTIQDNPLKFYNNPSEIMANATFNNGTLTWKYENTNLVTIFTFNNGELKNYKSIHIGTNDIQDEKEHIRLVFMNGGNTVATIRLYDNGERFLNFSDREELNGVDLSAITKISIGGESASGSVQISNIYLSQAEH